MGVLLLSPQKKKNKILAGASLAVVQPQPFCLALEKLCHSIPGAFAHFVLLFLLPLLSPSRSPPLELVFVEEFGCWKFAPLRNPAKTPLEFLLDEK